jgi:hypothetical protein
MTAADRAEINSRNASRSIGHRRSDGKSLIRFNAVKHGCRAPSPILPGEDPEVFQHRRDAWVDKFQPADDVELYLVETAVKASWQLDRAQRAEVAQLVEEIGREANRRAAQVVELGAKLFRIPSRPNGPVSDRAGLDLESLLSWPFDPAHPEYPARLVARLEATAAGCSWLLEQWAELQRILDAGRSWRLVHRMRAIRLLGKQPMEVVGDESLMTIYLACHAMDPDGPGVFAEPLGDLCAPELEASRDRLAGKFATARAARAALKAIIAAAVARVSALREVRAAAAAAGLSDISARLSYNAKVTVEWLHKHQGTCSRSLFRTFEELRKLWRDPSCPSSAVVIRPQGMMTSRQPQALGSGRRETIRCHLWLSPRSSTLVGCKARPVPNRADRGSPPDPWPPPLGERNRGRPVRDRTGCAVL